MGIYRKKGFIKGEALRLLRTNSVRENFNPFAPGDFAEKRVLKLVELFFGHYIYIATETYVGLATNFKERYRNHKTSFRHSKRKNETELSKYVWNLQNEKKPFQIKWKILKKCKPYSNINKKCSLCLNEQFIIICKKELCSLNRRNKLASSCPHRNRYVLGNFRVT